MSVTAWISLVVSLPLMLLLAGYMWGRRSGGRNGRRDLVAELAQLRRDIESEGGLSGEQVCLLFDVCQRLGLTEGEIQAVVGPGYWLYLDVPADVEGML